jgi:predicted AlkP superfamily pyrophosphatase or phosphodiesterase
MSQSSKVILILCDAMRYDAAKNGMGFFMHLVERKLGSLYKVTGELPTNSRPMYETIHTGAPVIEHGIYSNHVERPSKMPNIFKLATEAGKTTAAAALYWFSELYGHNPYDRIDDREVDDPSLFIQHGRYYIMDPYPDLELFIEGAVLVRKFNPDYLLIHPMGMDDMGETYGADSPQYRNNAIRQDSYLANLVPEWMERGYSILLTGDHGINNDKQHGGATPEMREVPLFMVRPGVPGEGDTGKVVSMLQIAPTICTLLGLPIPTTMKQPSIINK